MLGTGDPLVRLIAVCECGADMEHMATTRLPLYQLDQGVLRGGPAAILVDLHACPACGQNQIRAAPMAQPLPSHDAAEVGDA